MSSDVATDEMKILFDNCASGKVKLVSEFLDSKGNVDRRNTDDVTALQVAAANGQNEIVKVLIGKGASLEKYNAKKWNALLHAARNGHSEVVETLLTHQANVNFKTGLGANALLLASRKGDKDTCRVLMRGGIDTLRVHSDDPSEPSCDLTPLMIASSSGHESLVKFLITSQISDVNEQSASLGISALMLASLAGHESVVRCLLNKGADPNKTDINGRTALEFAMVKKHKKIINILSNITDVKSEKVCEEMKNDIIEATKKGNFQQFKELLDADITRRDCIDVEDGATPLMYACMAGRLDMVEELVERGCELDRQDSVSGWTALMQAVFHGKKTVAKYLIKAGADVHVRCSNGLNAFDLILLLDDVDTELYKILASATMEEAPNHSSKANFQGATGSMAYSKTKLKLLWSKLSERLKNMKNFTSNNSNNNNNNINNKETFNNNTSNKSPKQSTSKHATHGDNLTLNGINTTSTLLGKLSNSLVSLKIRKSKELRKNNEPIEDKSTLNKYATLNTVRDFKDRDKVPISDHLATNAKLDARKNMFFNGETIDSVASTSRTYDSNAVTKTPSPLSTYLLTIKNVVPPLTLPAHCGVSQTTAELQERYVKKYDKNEKSGKTQKKPDKPDKTVTFIEDLKQHPEVLSSPNFLPPPPSQLLTLKMPPTNSKNNIIDRDYKDQGDAYALYQPAARDVGYTQDVLSNFKAASIIHSSTLKKLKEKHQKKQEDNFSSSSDSSQLSSLNTPHQMTVRELSLFSGGYRESKVHSSASSSTGTLTAGSESYGKPSVADVKDVFSDSSTLVDGGDDDFSHVFLSHQMSRKDMTPVQDLTKQYLKPQIDQDNPSSLKKLIKSNHARNNDLTSLLRDLSLEQYQSLFDEHEIDMEAFVELTESNLKELGVMQEKSREILLKAILEKKNENL